MKLTDRTELTTGFTVNDLLHVVNGGTSYKAKFAAVLAAFLGASTTALIVHVAKNGNDSAADGSRAKPFLTIANALASITDAATGKRYGLFIAPGTYAETSLVLKPFVYLFGLGTSQGGPTRVTVTGNKVTIASTFAAGNNRCGITNLYFSGSTGIEIDLAAIAATGSNVFELQGVGMNGNLTFIPNNAADFLDHVTGRVFGTTTLQGGNVFFQQVYFAGGAINTNTVNQSLSADFLACSLAGALTATSSGGKTNTTRLLACMADGLVTSDQAATTVVFAASGVASVPVSTNSGVISSQLPASLTSYSAANPAYWVTSAPADVKAAIDRLAAVVSVNGATPIP